jgi:peptidyl-prolyl cis-trans isomerase A (cyclophilin A)
VASQLTAHFTTNHGTIVVNLFPDQAPKTVENFVGLAEGTKEFVDPSTKQLATRPFYDGLVFHRIIADFMLQGGDPLGDGRGGPGYEFEDEFHPDLQFDRPYLLAMANAGPNTNGSQFFITLVATAWLTRKHTIFGEVADDESRAVVDAIGAVPTDRFDKPDTPVVIESVRIERAGE